MLNEKSQERATLFGAEDPDQYEEKLRKEIKNTEKMEQAVREERELLKSKAESISALKASIEKELERLIPCLSNQEKEFGEKLQSFGFSNEENFLKYRISQEERSRLIKKDEELNKRENDILSKIEDRNFRYQEEIKKKLTDKGYDEIKSKLNECEIDIHGIGEKLGAVRQKIKDNLVNKKKYENKFAELKKQKEIFNRWDRLHSLIGSADGKKFRNFAQGLTFQMMILYANKELSRLSDRYLLMEDMSNPLELNVIDNYQGGEIRSSRNLSGGESFLVSLSLALGLSKMAGSKTPVDSLFLDEGFGTLDEDALDVALNALAGLRTEGKLIGLISHVSALKDRINLQLNVIPKSGGRSVIEGVGCRRGSKV